MIHKEKYVVYVAGAISAQGAHDHPFLESLNNMRRGIKWCIKIWKLGFVPYCPFFDFLFWLVSDDMLESPIEMIKSYSIEHEKRCQVVFIIPNEMGYTKFEDSTGVKNEIDIAGKMGISVVYSIGELKDWEAMMNHRG